MNRFIPKHFINEILAQTNIIDVINTRIKLKKYGKNYYSICPFHSEIQPSFTVNDEKQYFHCFGCNIHGNIIDFLMKYEQYTFLESIEELAYINGSNIPYKDGNKYTKNVYYKKQKIYHSMEVICHIYHKNIQSDNAKIAQLYLKKRKINQDMIKYFNIGYSYRDKKLFHTIDNINNHINNLIAGGVLYLNKQGKQYDLFQGRIIFPIKDKYGRITGFGGRSLNNIQPKYINSPTTDIFNKSNQLYGIYEIKKHYSKPKNIIVVEGYFDVISLTQFNIKYVVSSLGTATTDQQIQQLFKISNHIIYCYDGDLAGQNAAWKTFQKTLLYIHDGYSIKFIFLPCGEDPDSIIHKEGTEQFQKRIDNAMNIIDFFFQISLKKIDISNINGKITLLNLAIPLINKIPSTLTKLYFRKNLGTTIGIIDEYQLQKIFDNKNTDKIQKYRNTIKSTNMRILISLLIQNPKLVDIIPHTIQELKNNKIPGLSLFLEIFNICDKNQNLTTGQIIEFYRENTVIFNIIKQLACWDNMIDKKKIKNVFLDLITKLYNIILEKKYNKLIHQERIIGLDKKQKYELWMINKALSKKNIK